MFVVQISRIKCNPCLNISWVHGVSLTVNDLLVVQGRVTGHGERQRLSTTICAFSVRPLQTARSDAVFLFKNSSFKRVLGSPVRLTVG
jgi:hypothetical protein